jgi:hypothetical protein
MNALTPPRALVPPGAVGQAEEPVDWEALRAGCAKLWPELTWRVSGEGANASLWGDLRQLKLAHAFHVSCYKRGKLTVSLTSPRQLPSPWDTYISADVPFEDIPTLLPRLLADGRRWWGHEPTPRKRRRTARGDAP